MSLCCLLRVVDSEEKRSARRGGVERRLVSLFKVSCFYLKEYLKDIRKQVLDSEKVVDEGGSSAGDRLIVNEDFIVYTRNNKQKI